mmetsp:Transcript_112708/g.318506  ORF Transcript_112708/g.318506 Transcript_112708/m.318506 type:complete len:304 (+) Transcript_112708:86-997(+)
MVCVFGLGPDTSWLSPKGKNPAALDVQELCSRFEPNQLARRHSDLVALSDPSERVGSDSRRARASAFNGTPEESKDAPKEEAEEKKEMQCFPSSSSVYVKGRGPTQICDLAAGDLLLSGDGARLSFSPFVGYLHKDCKTYCDCIQVVTSDGNSALSVSPDHLVYASGSSTTKPAPVPAQELRVGDWISRVGCDGDLFRSQITEVSVVSKQGLYAPLTQCGTVVVDGSLCSCYGDVRMVLPLWLQRLSTSHEVAHGALLPLRLACHLDPVVMRGFERNVCEGIHPYCRALMALMFMKPSLVALA